MNYIYDILVNFNTKLYDVYEWNKKDTITHIRKIPLCHIQHKILLDFIYKNVRISEEFLSKIYNRTEKFIHNKTTCLDYCFLGTDGKEVVVFKLDKNGYIRFYSKLLIEEEYEVLEYIEHIPITILEYEIIGNRNQDFYATRQEIKIKSYIVKEIHQMIQKGDYDKLHYLYLDCFEKEVSIQNIVKNIWQDLDKNWDKVYLKIYELLSLVSKYEN